MRMTPDTDQTVRCSLSGCSCVCFKPGSVLRSCDHCGHSWVAHAVEKLQLQAQRPSGCGPVEVALPGLVFDLSSLVLYGAQAVPVQLKILLDRLYSVLPPEQVSHILHTLGWSLGDYVRGYMLQAPSGEALDRWAAASPEEQSLILQQFLRFGETRPIVQLMTSPAPAAANPLSHAEPSPAPKSCQSNIDTLAEQNGGGVGRHLGQSPLRPVRVPSSAFHSLAPPTQEPAPPTKPNQEPRLAESRRREEADPRLHSTPAFKIKADPDTPNPTPPTCRQDARFNRDQEVDLQRGGATQGHASSLLNATRLPLSSPPEVPLPPFSSCFICPLPPSPFSSSLHPLPPSPFSLPFLSPAGARKGRVCCGVCGKSFYDKGTLKIHHNAVHLKIKHRCTVAGCAMVFSSLRSRNRHSANPNPRLHTGGGRDAPTHVHTHTSLQLDTRDRNMRRNTHDGSTAARKQEANTGAIMKGFNGHAASQQDRWDAPPPQSHASPTSPLSVPSTLSQSFSLRDSRSDCHTLAPPPPPLHPACASSLCSAPPLAPPAAPAVEEAKHNQRFGLRVKRASPACIMSHDYGPTGRPEEAGASPPTSQQRPWESGKPVPKKKPRKSSMPVKIERGKEGGSGVEEESCGVFRGLITP